MKGLVAFTEHKHKSVSNRQSLSIKLTVRDNIESGFMLVMTNMLVHCDIKLVIKCCVFHFTNTLNVMNEAID